MSAGLRDVTFLATAAIVKSRPACLRAYPHRQAAGTYRLSRRPTLAPDGGRGYICGADVAMLVRRRLIGLLPDPKDSACKECESCPSTISFANGKPRAVR